jgi:hypothetical protein
LQSARNDSSANSGVPANRILVALIVAGQAAEKYRRVFLHDRDRFITALATVLFKAFADSLAFRFGQVIDEQFAVQVIYFMLNANGKQALEFLFHRLAQAV